MRKSTRLATTIAWAAIPLTLTVMAAVWYAADPALRRGKDGFDRKVESFLFRHPEVIEEAVRRLEVRRSGEWSGEARSLVSARYDDLYKSGSPAAGNPAGDVTLVEFFDYNCPYCRLMAPLVGKAREDPGLRIVYKEFPVLGPNSTFAARATLAAAKQEKYVALHDALFAIHGPTDPSSVMRAAEKAGLDTDRLKEDMLSPDVQSELERNSALARALRINGTPGFVIGPYIERGAVDRKTLLALIHDARAEGRRDGGVAGE